MSLSPGSRLGPYEILDALGAGGMGEVYRARDPRLGHEVAIKVLSDALVADAGPLQRFEQEARAAAAINQPNILAVFDIGQSGGAPYIVSELLKGLSLRDALARGAFPSTEQWTMRSRSRVAWRRPTARGSCTATSSQRTSSSRPTATRRFSISASRSYGRNDLPCRTPPRLHPAPILGW